MSDEISEKQAKAQEKATDTDELSEEQLEKSSGGGSDGIEVVGAAHGLTSEVATDERKAKPGDILYIWTFPSD